jgi:hypothetical protein
MLMSFIFQASCSKVPCRNNSSPLTSSRFYSSWANSLSLSFITHSLSLHTQKTRKKTSSSFMMMANLEHTKKKPKQLRFMWLHVQMLCELFAQTTHFVKRFSKKVCILTLQCVFAVWLVELLLQSSIIKPTGGKDSKKCAAQLNSHLELDPHFGNCPTQRLF